MDIGYSRKNKSPKAKGSMAPLEDFAGLKWLECGLLRREREEK